MDLQFLAIVCYRSRCIIIVYRILSVNGYDHVAWKKVKGFPLVFWYDQCYDYIQIRTADPCCAGIPINGSTVEKSVIFYRKLLKYNPLRRI